MMSARAWAKLRASPRTPADHIRYFLDCVGESFANIRAGRSTAWALTLYTFLVDVAVAVALAPFYLFLRWDGYTLVVLITLGGSLLVLLWALLHIGLLDSSELVGLNLANAISLTRFFLVAPVTVLLFQGHLKLGLALYVLSMASDVLDGIVARMLVQSTRFGTVVDPLADMGATAAVFVFLFWRQVVPLWLLALLLLRYTQLVLGTLVLFLRSGPFPLRATPAGKIVGVVQALSVILIIVDLDRGWGRVAGAYVVPGLALAFGAVIVSQTLIGWKHISRQES